MSRAPARAVLGLGSNLGDRAFHLRAAVASLADEVTAVSSVYETEPVGGPEQGAYLNLVAVLATDRTPHELLDVARRLETAAERVRAERWGPRTLDVDVLWVDGEAVDDPDLTVPHPRMFERDFVLAPLAEVAGDLVPAEWAGPGAGVVRLGPLTGPLPDAGPDAAAAPTRRRQVIETALDLDPDLYLDQIGAALARAGLGQVDEDRLVEDLEALGFVVDDVEAEAQDDAEPELEPGAPAPDADAEEDVEADPLALVWALGAEAASRPAPARPAPDRPDRSGRSRLRLDRTVVIAAVVALVVVGVAFALGALGDDGEEPELGPAATLDAATDPPNLGGGSGPVGPIDGAATEVGPGGDPELAAGGDASLSFDDTDGDQLPALGDRPWEVARGQVSVIDQRVVAAPGDDFIGALATVDAGGRDLRFELALPDASEGTGVAFGVRDDGSFLLWAPALQVHTLALFSVHGGEAELLVDTGAVVQPGVRLGVHVVGPDVELLAGGSVVATATDDSGSTRVGMGLHPAAAYGVLDDVVWAAAG